MVLAFLGPSLVGLWLVPRAAAARPIQIIHTNDLHSHFEHADIEGRGGYAAVKATIGTRGFDTSRRRISRAAS